MDTRQVRRDDTGTMRCRECGFPYALSPLEVAARADRGLDAAVAGLGEADQTEPGVVGAWAIKDLLRLERQPSPRAVVAPSWLAWRQP